ncbi:MAG: YbgC/FadM family acyl-CoA thioesterase [Rubrivivax sp.]
MTRREDFRFFDVLRVRWAEVDLQKIVFNGHYLMYLDTAVAGYWRALALPYHEAMHMLGGDLYVRKATLEYHASAHYDERLEVGMRCQRIGNSSILFTAGIFRGDTLLVSGELVYVFADPQSQTSRPVPPALREILQGFEAGQPMFTLEMQAEPGDLSEQGIVARNRLGQEVGVARLGGDAPASGDSAPAGRLQTLDVHAGVRGSGIGRALVEAAASGAREQGWAELRCRTPRALAGFLQRVGFSAREPAVQDDAAGSWQEMVRLLPA